MFQSSSYKFSLFSRGNLDFLSLVNMEWMYNTSWSRDSFFFTRLNFLGFSRMIFLQTQWHMLTYWKLNSNFLKECHIISSVEVLGVFAIDLFVIETCNWHLASWSCFEVMMWTFFRGFGLQQLWSPTKHIPHTKWE